MAQIDQAMFALPGFPGYRGDPPSNEAEFNALFGADNPWVNQPTWAQVQVELQNVKAQDNKKEAQRRIALTDWSVLPDVNLQNKADFEAYRATLRDLIFNPVADPVWPVEPTPIPATQGA
jgi:hypothetical protein